MDRIWYIIVFLCCVSICRAEERREILWTTDRDYVEISYDVQYKNNQVDITFHGAKVELGKKNSKQYKKTSNIDVVFFDRVGVYNGMTFTNQEPRAFMVPSCCNYTKSANGYFFVNDTPRLSLLIKDDAPVCISIPLYLAYHEGRNERKLFGMCDDFCITIGTSNMVLSTDEKSIMSNTKVLEDDEELANRVTSQIKAVKALLSVQTQLPFNDGLQYEIITLRNMQEDIEDWSLLSRIKECLTECELKKSELEQKASMEEKQAQIEAEILAQKEREEEKARQDAIINAQKEQEEAAKKRTIWMIIGGIILAVVSSVANQIVQHLGNVRNQRNMMEMQQEITRRAESDAKRHAQGYARRKTNEAINTARRSVQDVARMGAKETSGKRSKKISI